MVFACRIAHAADADFRRDGLQLAVAVHFAGEAVERMIREHQLNDIFPQPAHLLRFGENVHPRRERRMARRDDAARPVGGLRDLDGTHAARAIRLELRRIAERRHMPAPAMAVDEIEERVAVLELVRCAVDVGGDFGKI
jgi:hypothetical protein